MTCPRRRALLALVCLALCATALAACGAGTPEPTAAELLRQTFGTSDSAVQSARMNLAFRIDPEGLLAIGGPLKLDLEGPFVAPRAGELPRFDVEAAATLGANTYDGSVLSTGRRVYLGLDEETYKVDGAYVDRLRAGLRASADPRGLRALGFDPLRWISAPARKGSERIDGVDTIRIGGKVDAERLLGDVDRLLTKAGGAGRVPSLLPAQLRRRIAGAVSSATADVWTGASDKVVRRLAVKIVFFFELGQSPVQGLNGGTVTLRLDLADVNTDFGGFDAPTGARDIAEVTGGGAGNILLGIGAGLTGGKGRELFRCVTGAAGSSPDLVRCISKLAP